jgi:hypothetical protein
MPCLIANLRDWLRYVVKQLGPCVNLLGMSDQRATVHPAHVDGPSCPHLFEGALAALVRNSSPNINQQTQHPQRPKLANPIRNHYWQTANIGRKQRPQPKQQRTCTTLTNAPNTRTLPRGGDVLEEVYSWRLLKRMWFAGGCFRGG